MRPETVKRLGSYGHFDMFFEKIYPPTPEIEGGENTPRPYKTALLKTRENGPGFLIIKNGFLGVRITISYHHINSTINFFILCAKNLKKMAYNYKL